MGQPAAQVSFKIENMEKGEDGFLYVSGYGTTTIPVPFSDPKMPWIRKLKFTPEFLKAKMADYVARKPKVRMMHNGALGTGGKLVDYRVDDQGVWVKICVAPGIPTDLVEGGFYTELSIGSLITQVKRMAEPGVAETVDGRINEYSLVDEGKAENTAFTITRAVGDDEVEEGEVPAAAIAGMKTKLKEERAMKNLKPVALHVKRFAETIVEAGKTLDLSGMVVERGMGSVMDVLNAFNFLSSARASEAYEEAREGGEGGEAGKFLDAMLAVAELAIAHLLEEFTEIFGKAGRLASGTESDNVKRAADLSAPLFKAAELAGEKVLLSELAVKRFEDAVGMVVLRAKGDDKPKDEKKDGEKGKGGDSFHDKMAVEHDNASKLHADAAKMHGEAAATYVKAAKGDAPMKAHYEAMGDFHKGAEAHHEGMAGHHETMAKLCREAADGMEEERAAAGAPGKGVELVVDRVAGVEEKLKGFAAEPRVKAFEDKILALLKPLEGFDAPTVVNRLAEVEKGAADDKKRLSVLDAFLKNLPGRRAGEVLLPVERAAGQDEDERKRRVQCARLQIGYQASADKSAKMALDVMRSENLFDEKLSGVKTWEDALKTVPELAPQAAAAPAKA